MRNTTKYLQNSLLKSKAIILLLLTLSGTSTKAQHEKETQKTPNKSYVELMTFPPFIFSFGLGVKTGPKTEQVLSINSTNTGYFVSAGVRYNYNYFIRQKNKSALYIPFWSGVRGVLTFGGEESTDELYTFYNLGSGIGANVNTFTRQFVKFELGAGAAIMIQQKGYDRTHYLIYKQNQALQYSLLPSLRLNIRYAFILK